MIAEENIKDTRQSTLRRILMEKEEKARDKIETMDIGNKMLNWAKLKGIFHTQNQMKSERKSHINQFSQLNFVPKTFEERQSTRKRDIP